MDRVLARFVLAVAFASLAALATQARSPNVPFLMLMCILVGIPGFAFLPKGNFKGVLVVPAAVCLVFLIAFTASLKSAQTGETPKEGITLPEKLEFTAVDVDMPEGQLTIRASTENAFCAWYDKALYFLSARVEEGVLKVTANRKGKANAPKGKGPTVLLFVKHPIKVNVRIGTGNLILEGVEAVPLRVDVGTGNVKGENCRLVGGSVFVGVGNVDISAKEVSGVNFRVGVGNATVVAEKLADVSANVGIGKSEVREEER